MYKFGCQSCIARVTGRSVDSESRTSHISMTLCSHDLEMIDYIQYKGEKSIYPPIQLPIQEHLAS